MTRPLVKKGNNNNYNEIYNKMLYIKYMVTGDSSKRLHFT